MESQFDFDYIVIGSGFGGSVSALRLSEKGYKVAVIERGKRFSAADYAKTNWDVRRYLWMPLLKCFGIQNLSLFKNVLILSGSGVGGGSLVYANTLLEPGDTFYKSDQLKALQDKVPDWRAELAPHYQKAKQMLGVTKNPVLTEVDENLKQIATEMGRVHTFSSVDVAVFFGEKGNEGKLVPDPYFSGKGPDRAGCKFCGACMVGCQHNAKNTLDKNYLYLAEKNGVQIITERNVVDVKPIHHKQDGSEGYEVVTEKSTAWFLKDKKTFRAKGVIFSAGVLGTLDLLLRCKFSSKSLPKLSNALGLDVRTNSEALLGVTTRSPKKDFSKGIAITSGFYADEVTHIEPVRYPKGSSFMKLLAAPMADAGGPLLRPIKMLLATIKNPIDSLKLIFNTKWAESTVILLVMQTLDNKMQFKLGRNLFTLFRKKLTTETNPLEKVPSYIAIGHVVARKLADRINGIPQSAINEVMLQIPTTAHILGGCPIGPNPNLGVIDSNHQVFGYKNLYVCDGSVIPANLGVNPSLTITAMAERAMSKISKKDEEKK